MAMKKRESGGELKWLRAQVQEGKVILGTQEVLRFLRAKKISKIYVARNCPAQIKQDILHYARLQQVSVIQLEQSNEELGVFCKKNFFISVLGTLGE